MGSVFTCKLNPCCGDRRNCDPPRQYNSEPDPTHYVHFNGAAYFVKEADFFASQGGLVMRWGAAWQPVIAKDIEDAREMARTLKWR
ncbi:hypothetical protein Cp1R7AA1_191 [Mesorhizobium phage Cp1R7A-A1]|nr:hypothetical protein Cp1R7AA1_191 [Mesorhizobium phage Cp1R7A-A1]